MQSAVAINDYLDGAGLPVAVTGCPQAGASADARGRLHHQPGHPPIGSPHVGYVVAGGRRVRVDWHDHPRVAAADLTEPHLTGVVGELAVLVHLRGL
jgi:hypothetical protein